MESERESVKFFQLLYISDHIGSEFDGFITGMIDKGLFIELEDNHVEGFIPFAQMQDSFVLADNRLKALGKSTGMVLAMGDRIRIKVIEADMVLKRVELAFISKL